MKHILLVVMIAAFPAVFTNAQSAKIKKVNAAVNQLIKAMESGNAAELSAVTSDKLSYGHSGGKVENKQQFIHAFTSGASDFVKINISDQIVTVSKNVAIVRHVLDADTNDNSQPGHVKLRIMTVWQKSFLGKWKMLARQAVKPAS